MRKAKKIKEKDNITVVAVGASAGGLEALQDFFKNMPLDTNLAFVVIQHLSPDYKSIMDEILSRETRIPIQVIKDGMELEANNIYLIPPRKNISIFNNKLLLEEQTIRNGINLPIDYFFKSLAKEKNKSSIGVILSGTGSDGTLGIRAVKEFGGLVIVQDPKTAKFDGMPNNAISTGLVDSIIPAVNMPEEIINYLKHPLINKSTPVSTFLSEDLDTFSKILLVIRDFSGVDFSLYKENTIIRRLERRVTINRLKTLEEYLDFLLNSSKEQETLYKELLIGVTQFFRDKEAFEILKKKAFSKLPTSGSIRVWSVACSTGEEVYSLAIMLREYFEENNKNFVEIKIFATDVDEIALDKASIGFYPESIVSDIDQKILLKYFSKLDNGYKVKDNLRKMVIFAKHNVLKDPPFSKIDLLTCRNLFIYFKPEIQKKVLSMFYYSLNQDGILFMGSSETLGEMSDAFQKIDTKWKIYKSIPEYKEHSLKDNSLLLVPIQKTFSVNRKVLQSEKILQTIVYQFLPPSVILDSNDNIVQTINEVSDFLKLQPGIFSQNIFNNLPNELGLFVASILRKLKKSNGKIISEKIEGIKSFEKEGIIIEGRILNIDKSNFYLLSFKKQDLENYKNIKKQKINNLDLETENSFKLLGLEKELQFTRENLQATVEELETSNEELQSSNEELIASNEELQSSNEELQSVNEELYTVNSEYQNKIQELLQLNNDINNLLKNTEIGAIYIDKNLKIRKITPFVSQITNIIQLDIGRTISHISVIKNYDTLVEDIYKVLDDLKPINKEIQGTDNKVYYASIRPYRSENNSFDGILITFMDITNKKNETERANFATKKLNHAMELANMAWWEWDLKNNIVDFDPKKATMLGYTVDEFPKDVYKICDLIHHKDYESTMQIMRDHLEGRTDSWDATYRIKRKDGTYAWYHDQGIISERDSLGKPLKLIGTVIEVSKLKKLEIELYKNRELLNKIVENNASANIILDKDGYIIYLNKTFEDFFNIKKIDLENKYNINNWIIKTQNKEEILPFDIIKNSLKPITGLKYYVDILGKNNQLIIVDGEPLFDIDGNFDGVVFNLGIAN